MSDQPPVTVQRTEAPRYTNDLSDREVSSLVKIASYRALCGQKAARERALRAAIREALDWMPNGIPSRTILERALEDRP